MGRFLPKNLFDFIDETIKDPNFDLLLQLNHVIHSFVVMNQEFFSVLIQSIAAVGLAGIILGLSVLLGKRAKHREPADMPYECGALPIGSGSPMFSVKFYMVAMLFVIFDLEVVFLYPWAVNFRDFIANNSESFIAVSIFIGILFFAYLYALGKGALNWHNNPTPAKR